MGFTERKDKDSEENSPHNGKAAAVNQTTTVYHIVGLCFGLLCLLQATLNITLRLHYMAQSRTVDEKSKWLQINYTNLAEETYELLMNYTDLIEERDLLLTNFTDLGEERDLLLMNNTDLLEDRDLCVTSYNNLAAEKKLLLTNYSNLVKDKSKRMNSYNSLVNKKNQLLASYLNMANDKKTLLSNYNNLVVERDRLHRKLENAGWVRFQSNLYFFSAEEKNWYDSRLDCEQKGADLVIINNQEEESFLTAQLYNSWIGLHDTYTEGKWMWVDGTPLTNMKSTYWREHQPDDWQGNEDCAHFYENGWNDIDCYTDIRWTCEKEV